MIIVVSIEASNGAVRSVVAGDGRGVAGNDIHVAFCIGRDDGGETAPLIEMGCRDGVDAIDSFGQFSISALEIEELVDDANEEFFSGDVIFEGIGIGLADATHEVASAIFVIETDGPIRAASLRADRAFDGGVRVSDGDTVDNENGISPLCEAGNIAIAAINNTNRLDAFNGGSTSGEGVIFECGIFVFNADNHAVNDAKANIGRIVVAKELLVVDSWEHSIADFIY